MGDIMITGVKYLKSAHAFLAKPIHPQKSNVARYSSGMVRSNKSESSIEISRVLKDLSDRWDKVEDKTSVVLYGSGAIVLLWLASTIVGSVSNIPLLPKLMELVGLSYTAWFTYRYLLMKTTRQELVEDIEELKKKISGD